MLGMLIVHLKINLLFMSSEEDNTETMKLEFFLLVRNFHIAKINGKVCQAFNIQELVHSQLHMVIIFMSLEDILLNINVFESFNPFMKEILAGESFHISFMKDYKGF